MEERYEIIKDNQNNFYLSPNLYYLCGCVLNGRATSLRIGITVPDDGRCEKNCIKNDTKIL